MKEINKPTVVVLVSRQLLHDTNFSHGKAVALLMKGLRDTQLFLKFFLLH